MGKNYPNKYTSLLVLLQIFIIKTKANHFCNPDFENYLLNQAFQTVADYQTYSYYIQNDACWYSQGTVQQIQVLTSTYASYSKMADLNSGLNKSYRLCQNVSALLPGQLYNLTFQFALQKYMNSTTVSIYMNGIFVKDSASINFSTVVPILNTVTYFFQANDTNNTTYSFCVDAKQTWNGSINYSELGVSALVDNFQLYQINIQTFSIQYVTQFDVNLGLLYLISNRSISLQMFQYIQNNTSFTLNNASVNLSFQYIAYANSYIEIQIIDDQNYDFSTLQCLISGRFQQYNFSVNIIYVPPPPPPLPPSTPPSTPMTILPQKSQESTIQNTAIRMSEIFFKAYTSIRIFGCSYYLSNFITFYNLIVIYNFLNLSFQPQFSYITLKKLAAIFFSNDSMVINFIKKMFTIQFNLNDMYNNLKNLEKFQQKIPQKIGSFSWFNDFGITSFFIQNNFVDLLMLFILIIKLFFVYGISLLFSIFIGKQFVNIHRFPQIFIVQFLCSSSAMTISSISTIVSSGLINSFERLNIILHILLFGIIVLLPFLYILANHHSFHYKLKKFVLNKRQIRKCNKAFRHKQFYYAFLYGLQVVIPFLIILNSWIFLSLITLMLFVAYFYNIKSFTYISLYSKIYRILFLSLITAHHISFVYLKFCTQLYSTNNQDKPIMKKGCQITGLIVIITVLAGGICEMLNSFMQFCFQIIKPIIQKLMQKYRMSKKKNKTKKTQVATQIVETNMFFTIRNGKVYNQYDDKNSVNPKQKIQKQILVKSTNKNKDGRMVIKRVKDQMKNNFVKSSKSMKSVKQVKSSKINK